MVAIDEAPEADTRRLNVLLVDDDQDDSTIFEKLISHLRGFRVDFTWTSDAETALDMIRNRHFDVHFVDYRLGRESGLDLIGRALDDDPCKAFVVVTGAGDESLAAESFRCGAIDYLPKNGLDRTELDRCIRHSINESATRTRQVRALRNTLFDGLTGVYTREAFLDAARRELTRSYAGSHSYALLDIRIDGLLKVSDADTPATGHEILREVGFALRDAMEPGNIIGRAGEDRFFVLTRVSSRAEAEALGGRLRTAVSSSARATVSIGIAVEAASLCYLNSMIAHAAAALEKADRKGDTTTPQKD